MPQIVVFLKSLGWDINLEKSSRTPSQQFDYLGLAVRTDTDLLTKPDLQLCQFRAQTVVSPRQLELTTAFRSVELSDSLHQSGSPVHVPLQLWLAADWDHSPHLSRFSLSGKQLSQSLVPWLETVWLLVGVQLSSPSQDLYLYMDSSLEGWGAVLKEWEGLER